jgi:hypothetical protein
MPRTVVWALRVASGLAAVGMWAVWLSMPANLSDRAGARGAAIASYGHNRSGYVDISAANGVRTRESCIDLPFLCQYVEPRSPVALEVVLAPTGILRPVWLVSASAEGRPIVGPIGREYQYKSEKWGVLWNAVLITVAFIGLCLVKQVRQLRRALTPPSSGRL